MISCPNRLLKNQSHEKYVLMPSKQCIPEFLCINIRARHDLQFKNLFIILQTKTRILNVLRTKITIKSIEMCKHYEFWWKINFTINAGDTPTSLEKCTFQGKQWGSENNLAFSYCYMIPCGKWIKKLTIFQQLFSNAS